MKERVQLFFDATVSEVISDINDFLSRMDGKFVSIHYCQGEEDSCYRHSIALVYIPEEENIINFPKCIC